jgi:hypothetical protein
MSDHTTRRTRLTVPDGRTQRATTGRTSSAPVLVCLAVAAAQLLAQAPPVTGTITVGATKISAKSISAISYKGAAGPLVSVLVSDKPADKKEFLDRTQVGPNEPLVPGIFEGAWKSLFMEKALSGLSFTVKADGKLLTNEFLVGGRDDAFSIFDDDLVLELKSTTPRFVGTLKTSTPTIEAGDHKVGVDLTFDVAVNEPGK